MENNKSKSIIDHLLPYFIKAGEESIRRAKKGLKITIKSDKSPVTDGDLAVDEILRNGIEKITPKIPIISEETVNLKNKNTSKTFWLIDPIDGTKEYIKNKDEYTLNAALISDGVPKLGIINAPVKKRIFYSYGKGLAFEENQNGKTTLNCEKKTKKGKVFALSHSENPSDDILKIYNENKVHKFTKMSSSLKFCIIAAGEADIYTCRSRAFEWDIAAGHAILDHAGGIVKKLDGNDVVYGKNDYKNPALLVKRSMNLDF